jgi:D-arabinose 1-dehydrogenase-like Zn-dependent alcohol dehydrogenase
MQPSIGSSLLYGYYSSMVPIQTRTIALIGLRWYGPRRTSMEVLCGYCSSITLDPKELGATHMINTSDSSVDLVADVLKATDGVGVRIALDTTGVQSLARLSFDFVRCHGRILQNGLAKPEDTWDVPMAELMNSGKQIIGAVQGDAVPQDYIPKMIQWFREGKFPINKMVKFYAVQDFQHALEDMRSGRTVKPVLIFPQDQAHVVHTVQGAML